MRVGVVGNADYEGLASHLRSLRETASSLGVELLFGSESRSVAGDDQWRRMEGQEEGLDAILTLGGDGTLLRGARLAGPRGIPLLGCNMGRLGFLTAVPGTELTGALERLVDGRYEVEERMALRVRVLPPDREEPSATYYAVNDAVVHKSGFARLITLRIWVDGEEVGQYSADGIVLATATGSTAYSLSAGGPVLSPDLDALVATPICPHTLAVRSLVLSGSCRIRIQALAGGGEETVVTVDGQRGSRLTEDHQVEVRRSASPLRLVRFPERTFFTVLRRKLGWGDVRPRDAR